MQSKVDNIYLIIMKIFLKHNNKKLAKYLILFFTDLFYKLSLSAQNVADSDLSNNAGTNTNWYGQGWFWVVGAVVLAVLVWAISRDRTKRRLEGQRKNNQHFKNVR